MRRILLFLPFFVYFLVSLSNLFVGISWSKVNIYQDDKVISSNYHISYDKYSNYTTSQFPISNLYHFNLIQGYSNNTDSLFTSLARWSTKLIFANTLGYEEMSDEDIINYYNDWLDDYTINESFHVPSPYQLFITSLFGYLPYFLVCEVVVLVISFGLSFLDERRF